MFKEKTVVSVMEVGQGDQYLCGGKYEKPKEEGVKETPQVKEKEKKAVRILIVDDEPDMLEALSDVLEQKGYDVEMALDGEEAIDKAKKKVFDITFIDIKLPGIDGIETFQAIKKSNPRVLALMITAYSLPELEKKAIEGGAHKCLHKPFSIDKVIELIESYRKGMLK